MLKQKQMDTLVVFLDTLTLILAESHQMASIGPLRDQVNTVIALMERDFPISIHVRISLCNVSDAVMINEKM